MKHTYVSKARAFLGDKPALRRFRTRRLAVVIIKMILTAAVLAAITVFLYWQSPHIVIMVVGAIVGLSAVYRVGMPHRYFPKMCATVEKKDHVQKRVKNPNGLLFSANSMIDTVILVATVKTSRGTYRKLELPIYYDEVWQVGDTILQIPGIPYFVTPDPQDKVVCPYCGNVMPRTNDYCVECKQINIYDTPA